jgi:hypothetical protein
MTWDEQKGYADSPVVNGLIGWVSFSSFSLRKMSAFRLSRVRIVKQRRASVEEVDGAVI